MRRSTFSAFTVAVALVAAGSIGSIAAQTPTTPAPQKGQGSGTGQGPGATGQAAQSESSRKVEGGGVFAPGWIGKIDANEEKRGQTLNNAKLAKEGDALHVTTGPATTYWNPANKASGNYTVKATFNEPKFMNLNDHPHPYGIVIGGNDLGTDQQSYLYCAAYGSGTFIVRGFGPEPFQMGGRRPEANAAVHKAAGPGQPVTQEIALSVKDDKVECAINGTVVASYDKSAVVTPGKLKSTDGIYGVRFAHNTDAIVTGLTVTK
jgi:hypothetical protein